MKNKKPVIEISRAFFDTSGGSFFCLRIITF